MKTKNILLVGVGGQGTITAAKLLTTGLMEAGYDVKMSEIHGMSQRGEMGTADIIVAFEKMEALRYIDFLKEDGKIIVNDTEIWPLPVVIGKATYPEKILETLQEKADVRVMNASAMAEEMGNLKVMNVILLGAIIKSMGLQDIDWDEIIRNNVKPKFVDLNIKAMAVGMNAVN